MTPTLSIPGGHWTVAAIGFALTLVCGCAGSAEPVAISGSDQFEREVLHASGPVVVDYYETLCPACVVLGPTYSQLAGEYAGRARFMKMEANDAKNAGMVESQRLYSWPTVVLYSGGKEQQRWVYVLDKDQYRMAINNALTAKAP